MVNFDSWLGETTAVSETPRAVAAWNMILDKPSSITIRRLMTAQTVRLEYGEAASDANTTAGRGVTRGLTVFGVVNHPTVADTNIRANDRFVTGGSEYEVKDVVRTLGSVQAQCERVS